jgi:hypothetical protein
MSKVSRKATDHKQVRAEAADHLDLVLHFEAIFERILEECEDCRTCAVEALARETVEWIEGFDAALE